MKTKINILALLKYNLLRCYRKNIVLSALFVTLLVCVIYMVKVGEYSNVSNNLTNQWDYFFRIFQNPFILEWIFIPILFFITSPITELSNKNKYIYVRANQKSLILFAEQLTNLIIITSYIILFAIVVFLLGIYYSRFGSYWSDAILNETNNQVTTKYLFFNNFILSYNPIQSMIVAILKYIGTIYLIILLRDAIIYITKRGVISIFICFSYLFSQYMGPDALGAFSIANLATLWHHNIKENSHFGFSEFNKLSTVPQSNITLILNIIVLIIFSLIIYRRTDSEKI